MTYNETKKIVNTLFVLYNSAYKGLTCDDITPAWHTFLEPCCFALVNKIVKEYIPTHNYPPRVNDILQEYNAYIDNCVSKYKLHYEWNSERSKCKECNEWFSVENGISFFDNAKVLRKCGGVLCPKSDRFEKLAKTYTLTSSQLKSIEILICKDKATEIRRRYEQ